MLTEWVYFVDQFGGSTTGNGSRAQQSDCFRWPRRTGSRTWSEHERCSNQGSHSRASIYMAPSSTAHTHFCPSWWSSKLFLNTEITFYAHPYVPYSCNKNDGNQTSQNTARDSSSWRFGCTRWATTAPQTKHLFLEFRAIRRASVWKFSVVSQTTEIYYIHLR